MENVDLKNETPAIGNVMLAEVPEHLLCSAIWFDDGVDTYVHQPRNITFSGFVSVGDLNHKC